MYSKATAREQEELARTHAHNRCEIVDMTTFLAVTLALLLGTVGTTIGSIALYDSIHSKPDMDIELTRNTHSEMIAASTAMSSNEFCAKSSKTSNACNMVVQQITSAIYSANFDKTFKHDVHEKQISASGFEIKFQLTTLLSGEQINRVYQTCTNSQSSTPKSRFTYIRNFEICVLPDASYVQLIFGASESIEAVIFMIVSDEASDATKNAFESVMIKFTASVSDSPQPSSLIV